ncbi:hydroxyacylglutathione hydrolase [Candidatus Palibaumannia cicadellinicola]|uniref:Hydroxyacylglutathione hydrolase n=1 Tax=Baumannia cicadellinicola subsp. Homalodisca coagulata TaxID=374463 RepID=GLO2_BAUCH|nr:hydroxyacylglutathione hydrolase [Candidatus Baumannia cicadellinicola]Q1LT01.1 RecName: Full=Hydroxyacylglutathione hydrolase; AltName: Full=Glyoxalase II; Short=Glx II [Baumannia cicadellinicola str. Hc (Homalodisca coagulata)]ABF14337.1 hydroxyacylglutathione hydrolase [Baumannia cicadellinicola str. Hc (Homalodisca coagulata)]MBS0032770.1 hydroxyacylglutathione hydrolase [Candidatus Baumannia cicadellinicola]MCJ7462049.1 hydroxyacylglutathione hydrolase [Candidatus Baumannia cicadellinic
MNLIAIPALIDNYIWLLHNKKGECLIVDPGDATPVLHILSNYQLKLTSILLTHHHPDHVKGVKLLSQYFPVTIYGPQETFKQCANIIVKKGDFLVLLEKKFAVLSFPGHTLGHIGFYSYPWLFCGDTVFSAGCGRIFEGTTKQMYESFQEVNQLSSHTLICCAHEYTLTNLAFASSLLPKDRIISSYQRHVTILRNKKKPSLPTKLSLERLINPFFRCHDINLHQAINFSPLLGCEWLVFDYLRQKRDNFRGNSSQK